MQLPQTAARYYLAQSRFARRLVEELLSESRVLSQTGYPELVKSLGHVSRKNLWLNRFDSLTAAVPFLNRFDKALKLGAGWASLTRITRVVDLGLDPRTRCVMPHSFSRPRPLRILAELNRFTMSGFASEERTRRIFSAVFPDRLWDRDLYVWLRASITDYLLRLPAEFAVGDSFGKLMRTMLGTVFFNTTTFDRKNMKVDVLKRKLSQSFKSGYWYGVTYLIDDIMDSNYYSETDKRKIFRYLVVFLSGGKTAKPPLDRGGRLAELLYSALVSIGELNPKNKERLYRAYYVLVMAQLKEYYALRKGGFNWSRHGHLLMMKAGYTRIIAALLADLPVDRDYYRHAFLSGLAIQLIDDLRDVRSDLDEKTNTPFTALADDGGSLSEMPPLQLCCAAMVLVSRRFRSRDKALDAWAHKLAFALKAPEPGGGSDTEPFRRTGLAPLDRALAGVAQYPLDTNISEMIILAASEGGARARRFLLEQVST